MSRADKVAERARGRPPLPGYRKDQRLPQQSTRVPTNQGLMKKGSVNPKSFKTQGGAKLPDVLYGGGAGRVNDAGLKRGPLPDAVYGRSKGLVNQGGLRNGDLPDAIYGRSTGQVTQNGLQHGQLPNAIYGGKGNLRRKK